MGKKRREDELSYEINSLPQSSHLNTFFKGHFLRTVSDTCCIPSGLFCVFSVAVNFPLTEEPFTPYWHSNPVKKYAS